MDTIYRLEANLAHSMGKVGLVNLGNTCYMNAAMQALMNCDPLVYYIQDCYDYLRIMSTFKTRTFRSQKADPLLLDSMADLLDMYWSDDPPRALAPKAILRDIAHVNRMFSGYAQHDSQEFIGALLDRLHEETFRPQSMLPDLHPHADAHAKPAKNKRKKVPHRGARAPSARNQSMISDLFEGTLRSQVTCLTCGNSSFKFDPFMTIPIEIGNALSNGYENEDGMWQSIKGVATETYSWMTDWKSLTLEECLERFCEVESLNGGNRYRCTSCNDLTPSTKSLRFHHLPEILVICLKRFSHHSFYSSKVTTKVTYPVTGLNMDPFTIHHETPMSTPANSRSHTPNPQSDSASSLARKAMKNAQQTVPHMANKTASGKVHADGLKKSHSKEAKAKTKKATVSSCGHTSTRQTYTGKTRLDAKHGSGVRTSTGSKSDVGETPELTGRTESHATIHFREDFDSGSDTDGDLSAEEQWKRDMQEMEANNRCSKYNLTAVINHSGGLGNGHYIGYARHFINNEWFKYDDSHVTKCKESDVKKVEGYVLFYQKDTTHRSAERLTIMQQIHAMEMEDEKRTSDTKPSTQASRSGTTKNNVHRSMSARTSANPRAAEAQTSYLVARTWFTKWLTVAEPGPITNTDVFCRHGGITPQLASTSGSMCVRVPAQVWNTFVSMYGGGPAVTQLTTCVTCERDYVRLQNRREYERDAVHRLHDEDTRENNDIRRGVLSEVDNNTDSIDCSPRKHAAEAMEVDDSAHDTENPVNDYMESQSTSDDAVRKSFFRLDLGDDGDGSSPGAYISRMCSQPPGHAGSHPHTPLESITESTGLTDHPEQPNAQAAGEAGARVTCYYMVPISWMKQWSEYTRSFHLHVQPPGAIDTSFLINGQTGRPKTNMKKGVHYDVVGRRVWAFLCRRYGCAEGSVPIMRTNPHL
ncbi:hypothetical protein, variant [Sphaeroforma arctica JP610]|nr:hypothetical protein, variant [Sphaeroforma arctica JP610]KNC84248.1 hypothetical protein, variant [Sphaeroforma arctica JP610]|eukprot:XP_014158150.1 hypothetical protein, variant [Sphaeroforma arctica JP610]